MYFSTKSRRHNNFDPEAQKLFHVLRRRKKKEEQSKADKKKMRDTTFPINMTGEPRLATTKCIACSIDDWKLLCTSSDVHFCKTVQQHALLALCVCAFHFIPDVLVKNKSRRKKQDNEGNRSQVRPPYRNKDSCTV